MDIDITYNNMKERKLPFNEWIKKQLTQKQVEERISKDNQEKLKYHKVIEERLKNKI